MRKKREFDDGLVQEVAKCFYGKDMDKTEIAEDLRAKTKQACDRHTVNKILKLALERGLVHIEFPEKEPAEIKLARRVKTAFPHLQKVIVLPNRQGETYEDLLERWAEAAAECFEELLRGISRRAGPVHVGISGGDTLFAVVNAIREERRPGVHVHTTALVGWGEFESRPGSKEPVYHIDPITNASILWNKLGRIPGQCHYATVPPLSGGSSSHPQAELERLYKLPPIRRTVDAMKDLRIAFAGLGYFSPIGRENHNINQLTVASLLSEVASAKGLQDVVGDLAYTLFDKNGQSRPEWEFFLTAGFGEGRSGLRFYQEMAKVQKQDQKYVIVIAGMWKRAVLMPALRAQCFNIWITDAESASVVLSHDSRPNPRKPSLRQSKA